VIPSGQAGNLQKNRTERNKPCVAVFSIMRGWLPLASILPSRSIEAALAGQIIPTGR